MPFLKRLSNYPYSKKPSLSPKIPDCAPDTDNNFLLVVDELASKRSSNGEVYGHIKSLYDVALRDDAFIDKNGKEKFYWQKRKHRII